MPEPTPQVTGSDILSYRGDPGLAAGANPGGVTPQPYDPFAGISRTIDRINEEQAQYRIMQYNQKIKEQEELRRLLTEEDGSVFNMKGEGGKNMSYSPLPEDQKILTQKAHELRKKMLDNPSGYKFDQDYLDKLHEYKNLTRHAGMRSVAFSRYNQEASQTNDPTERQSIMEMRRSEVEGKPLTDYYMPEPHMPRFSYDVENFISGKDIDKKNMSAYKVASGKDAAGNIIHTDFEGLNDNILDFRAKIKPGAKNYADAVNLADAYVKSISRNPQAIIEHNRNIDAINLQRGYVDAFGNPISPHFIPHVAEVVNGKNGPEIVLATNNPTDIAYSAMAEKYGALQETKKIKKDAEEVAKDAATAKYTQAQIDHLKEQERLARERLNFDKSKQAKEDAEKAGDEYAAASTVNTVYNTYTSERNKTGFRPLSAVPQLQPAFRDMGVNASDYEVVPINHTDNNIKDMAGVQSKSLTGAIQKGVGAPTAAYYLKSKTGIADDRIVIGVPEETKTKDKKNVDVITTKTNWIAVSPEDAVKNKISTMKNFNVTDKTIQTISRAQKEVNELIGGKAPTKTTTKEEDSEEAISSRLVPVRVKTKSGKIVDAMQDPKTGKLYAK